MIRTAFSEIDIEALFNNYGKIVEIGKRRYEEVTNVVYELDCWKISNHRILPPHKEDKIERDYLLERANDTIKILKNDIYSRQAIYVNLYDNKMGKCITTVHFFSRDGILHLNTYFRSQEYIKNFKYDYQTHLLLMKKVCNALELKPGTITVFCANLHRKLNDK